MKTNRKYLLLISSLTLILFIFFQCKKDDSTDIGTADVVVYLTDDHEDYMHLFLEVVGVDVKISEGWTSVTLDKADTIDILKYQNGDLYYLTEEEVEIGSLQEVRLILGGSSLLVLQDSTQHNLTVPSGTSSGLKVKVDNPKNLSDGGTYKLIVDFDAKSSILQQGNGEYKMKPVLRAHFE